MCRLHTQRHHVADPRQRAAHPAYTASNTWPSRSSMEGQKGNWASIMPREHNLMSPQGIPKKAYNSL